MGLLSVQHFLRQYNRETGNFYHGVAKCSPKKFASRFSLSFYPSNFVDVSGSIEPMIPILVKGDDVGSETKANARYDRLRPAQASIG